MSNLLISSEESDHVSPEYSLHRIRLSRRGFMGLFGLGGTLIAAGLLQACGGYDPMEGSPLLQGTAIGIEVPTYTYAQAIADLNGATVYNVAVLNDIPSDGQKYDALSQQMLAVVRQYILKIDPNDITRSFRFTASNSPLSINIFLPDVEYSGRLEPSRTIGVREGTIGIVPKPHNVALNPDAILAYLTNFSTILDEYNARNPESAGPILLKHGAVVILPFGVSDVVVPYRVAHEFTSSNGKRFSTLSAWAITCPTGETEYISQAIHMFTDFPITRTDVSEIILNASTYVEIAQGLTAPQAVKDPEKEKLYFEKRNNSIGIFSYMKANGYTYVEYTQTVETINKGKNSVEIKYYKFSEGLWNAIDLKGNIVQPRK